MAREGGNQLRCRTCHRLAGKDGWCKLHRPERKSKPMMRSNFLEDNFLTRDKEFWGDSYGIVREQYPCVRKGY
jgi:hypothetical protein